MAKHSIKFSRLKLGVNEAIDRMQSAVESSDLRPGGDFVLSRRSSDQSEQNVVLTKEGLSRERLPLIPSVKEPYDGISLTIWSDTMDLVLRLRTTSDHFLMVSIVFMGDILRKRGNAWTLKVMSNFQDALDATASLLCSEQDSGEVERRLKEGEDLADIVLKRVRGTDSLPKPLLALVKAELCTQDIHEVAREQGIRTGVTSKMYILFSTLDAA